MESGASGGEHRGHDRQGQEKGRSRRSRDLLAEAQSQLREGRPVTHEHDEHVPLESVREVEHDGHHITIRTIYEIEVDGQPLRGHIYVANDGSVSSHAMPAYKFTSAVDLIAKLIDTFPTEFERGARRKPGR
jgi:hypothetical protein